MVVVIVWQLDLQLPVQSVLITTDVSSNPIHGEVSLIQHYVVKFVSGFLQVLQFNSSTNKTDCHDIAEILLKVVLNTISLNQICIVFVLLYFQRDEVVSNFRCGKVWILICTELMGRGIDFKGVNLVINYDFPNSAINYIHRIGKLTKNIKFLNIKSRSFWGLLCCHQHTS